LLFDVMLSSLKIGLIGMLLVLAGSSRFRIGMDIDQGKL